MPKALITGSPARTAPTSRSCCSPRATRWSAWCAGPATTATSGSSTCSTGSRSSRPTCSTSTRSRSCSRRPGRTRSTTWPPSPTCPTSWTQPVLTGEFTALGVTRILEAIRLAHPDRALLPGELVRDVRQGHRDAAAREHRLLSAVALRRGQGVRPLDHGELPRVLRALRGERHPVQPRVAAPRDRVRDPQGHRRRRPHQARPGHASSGSATSRRGATGASPATTSTRCGGCCSRTTPHDYVVGTGETHSVRELVELAFAHVGLDWRKHVVSDPKFYPSGRGGSAARRPVEGAARARAGRRRSASPSWWP